MANNFPAIRPSLDLQFANMGVLDPRVTFTRASASGLYWDGKSWAKAEENLLLQSQGFSSISWNRDAAFIIRTADTAVAPDGTTTADSWFGDGTANLHYSGQLFTFLNPATYVFTVYVKAAGVNAIQLFVGGGSGYANFDVTAGAGAVGTAAAPFSGLAITSAGSDWYRCQCTITNSANANIYIVLSNNTSATRADVSFATSDGVYLWGAQLEQRAFATAYTPTTTQPITRYQPLQVTAPAGVPVFAYDPVTGEALGLQVWEQRTNLLLRSEEFSDSYWTKNESTISANQIIAPDGTLTADKLIESTAAGAHYTERSIALSTAAHTWSVYAKAAERTIVLLRGVTSGSLNATAFFDLSTGTTYGATNCTATIVDAGNGWYKCIIIIASASASLFEYRISLVSTGTTTSYTGDGTSGIYIWGAQLEAGAFATPYIKTEASQVTRLADSAAMTGANFSSWYRQDEGTLFAEGTIASADTTQSYGLMAIDSGPANAIGIGISLGTSATANVIRTMDVSQAGFNVIQTASSKASMSYAFNNAAFCTNGGAVQTDTSVILPAVTGLDIGENRAGAKFNGTIKRIAYYPKALTAAELQAVTR